MLGRKRQADVYEFKTSLLYIVSSRTTRAIERPCFQNKNKTKEKACDIGRDSCLVSNLSMETTEQQRLQDCPERSPRHSLAGDQGCLQLALLTALWDLEQRQAETVSLSPFPGPLIILPPWSTPPQSPVPKLSLLQKTALSCH